MSDCDEGNGRAAAEEHDEEGCPWVAVVDPVGWTPSVYKQNFFYFDEIKQYKALKKSKHVFSLTFVAIIFQYSATILSCCT